MEKTSPLYTGIIFLILSLFCLAHSRAADTSEISLSNSQQSDSPFKVTRNPERPRGFLLPPLASFFIPGLDQYTEDQFGYAAAFAGTAVGGLGMSLATGYSGNPSVDTVDNKERFYLLGLQIYQTAGSLSMYHSFRTAVKTRQPHGEFAFLKHEETDTDLMLSPLRFKYLARPTTFLGIPAMLLASYAIIRLQGYSYNDISRSLTASDFGFAGAFSYNAGLGEEAAFRGWMMPVGMYYTSSPLAANSLTSVIFGALHYRNGYIPISQTVGGFYLGWVAQQNEWQLGESIFIHAWYDVAAFLIAYATTDPDDPMRSTFRMSPISIPF